MKHFLVLIKYISPIEEIIKVQDEHRAILQSGVDAGIILFSGPLEPRNGGLVVLRSESIDLAKNFFQNDPYLKNKLAEYNFFQFNPGKHQDFLSNWINK